MSTKRVGPFKIQKQKKKKIEVLEWPKEPQHLATNESAMIPRSVSATKKQTSIIMQVIHPLIERALGIVLMYRCSCKSPRFTKCDPFRKEDKETEIITLTRNLKTHPITEEGKHKIQPEARTTHRYISENHSNKPTFGPEDTQFMVQVFLGQSVKTLIWNCFDSHAGPRCPSNSEGAECSGVGTCNRAILQCECPSGYSGSFCQQRGCFVLLCSLSFVSELWINFLFQYLQSFLHIYM